MKYLRFLLLIYLCAALLLSCATDITDYSGQSSAVASFTKEESSLQQKSESVSEISGAGDYISLTFYEQEKPPVPTGVDINKLSYLHSYETDSDEFVSIYIESSDYPLNFYTLSERNGIKTVIGKGSCSSGEPDFIEFDNILGGRGFCLSYAIKKYQTHIDYYRYDKSGTPLLVLVSDNPTINYDMDGDGTDEVSEFSMSDDDHYYIHDLIDGKIVTANISGAFSNYAPEETLWGISFPGEDIKKGNEKRFILYSYTNIEEKGLYLGAHDSVTRKAKYGDRVLYITDMISEHVDYNNTFPTNNSDWSFYYKMINGELTLECIDGRKYIYADYRGEERMYTNGISFDAVNAEGKTSLLINESGNLASLVYSVPQLSIDQTPSKNALIIDLSSGYIINRFYLSESELFSETGFDTSLLEPYKSDGYNAPGYSITCNQSLDGDNFIITFTLLSNDSIINLQKEIRYSSDKSVTVSYSVQGSDGTNRQTDGITKEPFTDTGESVTPENITIDSLDKWNDLGETYAEDYEYLYNILNGNIDSLKNVRFGNYTITKEYTGNGNEYRIRLDIKITASDVDTMPVGVNSYYVYGMAMWEPYIRAVEEEKPDYTSAQSAIRSYLGLSPTYSVNNGDENVNSAITYYIIGKSGTCTLEQMKAYAKTYFGIDNFIPEKGSYVLSDGKYTMPGRGYEGWQWSVVSETVSDGITTVTVQYYTDSSHFIKSHTVEYRMKEIEGSWAFLSSTVIYKSVNEPFRYSG